MNSEEMLSKIGKNLLEEGTLFGKEALSPKDCTTLYTKAYALYNQNNFEKAAELFYLLIQAQPFYFDHWAGYSSCLQMQGHYEKALSSWALAALTEESNPLPHFHAGECLFSMGEAEQGVIAMQRALFHAEKTASPLCDTIKAALRLKESCDDRLN
jgi:type III secretion system low calcium response chaperone LcrH/SycD